MNTLLTFEAGVITPEGRHSKLFESPDRKKVEDYLENMEKCKPHGFDLVLYEKMYHCLSTTPHTIKRAIER
tara:strand:- start:355 stop:567 length:213 start_codon:yes stop_codon:yes gene_type:complete